MGLGRPAASGGSGAGLGPESNSGTTSTMSATKIVAPIRRSLTRRSMSSLAVFMSSRAPQYIREDSAAAEARAPRANPAPAPPYGRSRRPRFDRRALRPARPPRSAAATSRAAWSGAFTSGRSARPIPRRCGRVRPRSRRTTMHRCSRRSARRRPPHPCRRECRKPPASCRRAAARADCARARPRHRDCARHPGSTVGPADSITWKRADEARRGRSSRQRRGRQLEARRDFLERRERRGRVRELGLPEKCRRREVGDAPARPAVAPAILAANEVVFMSQALEPRTDSLRRGLEHGGHADSCRAPRALRGERSPPSRARWPRASSPGIPDGRDRCSPRRRPSGSTTLTASRRPPMPTSSTHASSSRRLEDQQRGQRVELEERQRDRLRAGGVRPASGILDPLERTAQVRRRSPARRACGCARDSRANAAR